MEAGSAGATPARAALRRDAGTRLLDVMVALAVCHNVRLCPQQH